MRTIWIALAAAALLAGCKEGSTGSGKPGIKELNGAGATFPYPLYSKWVAEYQRTDPNVRINYQSIGSGGGIRQISEQTVDFGATDAPMTDAELSKAPGKLLHIPLTLGAVVLVYNVPGVDKLKLSPQVLSGLFLGHIKAWNDPSITAINPGVPLPAEPVTIVYRSDGSGTTAVFTEYLSKVSGAWKDQVGAGKSVRFPTGLGAKGNEGVSGQVKTNPRSLGYVELAYAKQTGLRYAALQNQSGAFVEPSLDAITAAAVGAGPMPDDLRVSIVNPEGAGAYPISAFSYVLVYEEQGDFAKGKALSQFLWWASHEGQKLGPALHYAPLPQPVIRAVETKLRSMKSANGPLLAAGR